MLKVVYNLNNGGFGLSSAAVALYKKVSGGRSVLWGELARHDPDLVCVVEIMGVEASSGPFSRLGIADVPEGGSYKIIETNGLETVVTTVPDVRIEPGWPTGRPGPERELSLWSDQHSGI